MSTISQPTAGNTGGVNGKQGGYYWAWCANVTMNPNPEGCWPHCGHSNCKSYFPSSLQVETYVATDAEHDAAKASVLELEGCAADDLNDAAKRKVELSTHEDAVGIEKRDSTTCNSQCNGVDRDLAVEAVNWFCDKYAGTEIDDNDDGRPISFSAN